MRSTTNQVSLTPSQSAVAGSTRSVTTSPGVDRAGDAEHAEPVRVAERILHFAQFRRALQLHAWIAALDRESQLLAGMDADDALHVGEAADRLAVDRGDDVAGLEAGGRAALSASTLSTRAVVLGLPKNVNRQAKITIARMKFAIGPAATIAARGPTFL